MSAGAEEKERKVTWDQLEMLGWMGLDHSHVLSTGWHRGTSVGLWWICPGDGGAVWYC